MFSFTNIEQYHLDLKHQKTSCKAAVQFYLDSIASQNHLNAFVEVYAEEAVNRALELDNFRLEGKLIKRLHGVVIALKDVICYKDHKVTAASKILNGFVSMYHASVVQYLLDEEAIIIGTCNCDEFAMGSSNENSNYGIVLNPIDNTKVPGGSSGGSAVAVKANMCMISLGSDTGGSVRQPADFCGIVGLKPGYGSVSRYGLIAFASSFDQIGIFGNNIKDVTLILEIISKTDEYDSTMNQKQSLENISQHLEVKAKKNYRIAFFKEVMNHPMLDFEIKNQIKNQLDALKIEGCIVEEIDFDLLDYVVPTYYILTAAEASSNLSRYDGVRYGHQTLEKTNSLNEYYVKNRSEGFGKEVKRRIMLGNFVLSSGYMDAYFTKAQQVRTLLIEKTAAVFKNYDVIVMPTSPATAFKLNEKKKDPVEMYLADIFTVFANLTGIPAISIPLFNHSNGMPFGLQLLSKKENELTLLQFAQQLSTQNKN